MRLPKQQLWQKYWSGPIEKDANGMTEEEAEEKEQDYQENIAGKGKDKL
jgi:hypothetical protein